MSIQTTPHLNFRGTARTALEFYQSIFGGHLTVVTYGSLGMPQDAPGADKVVFGQLESAPGFRVMAYDIPGEDSPEIDHTAGSTRRENGITITDRSFFLSVRGETLEEVTSCWERLAADAVIVEPLAASAWTLGFGMLTDRFGVTWVIDVATPTAG
ncbi:VOC family protein [Nesterenkonia sandarakina]|uniref:PhnB protein n=1 Tax=Nesterenkonia sandarakina TaxID=272918 RepID=A0A2T0YK82_9MICC|nr:VOC family protein [Nesterenkonia sandarakina]PRZ15590.1 PhnB protein [Nesterenkonia sandarakina]